MLFRDFARFSNKWLLLIDIQQIGLKLKWYSDNIELELQLIVQVVGIMSWISLPLYEGFDAIAIWPRDGDNTVSIVWELIFSFHYGWKWLKINVLCLYMQIWYENSINIWFLF